MKRLLGFLLLVLAATMGVAQDNPAAAPAIEMMALYKQAGRAWSYKIINSAHGEMPDVSTSTTTITSVEGAIAQCTTETRAADGSSSSSSNFTVDSSVVPEEAKAWVAADVPVVKLDMGFRVFECKKHRISGDGLQVTTWVSTEYHPLVVKQVTFESGSTSVHKLTSFSAAEVDPWLLYRMKGRSFKVKMEGEGVLNYFESTITGVSDDSAEIAVKQTDADGKQVGETKTEKVEFSKRLSLVVPGGLDEVKATGEETITVEAGEFDCYVIELKEGKAKLYFSKTWLELPVKMEMDNARIELVELDLGHDTQAFYRTVGNSYTQRSEIKVGGFNSESQMRWEVTAVTEDQSTFKFTTLDPNGNVLGSSSSSIKLRKPEEGEARTTYSGQVEELIETPAGRFPAIRVEAQGMVTWQWNGLVVKMKMDSRDMQNNSEITDLNMQ